jgi:hypothetical protein
VDDLHVDGELTATIVEDQDADAATARLESLVEASVQVGLVNDRETLLDVASLGHGDNVALLHVKDTVLLEDRAEHGLDDNAGGGVGDERGLLMKLLGEEVDTKVAVLAGGRGGRDTDDLAGAALEHQEVTEADVVAGDGDGVGEVRLGRVTGTGAGTLAGSLGIGAATLVAELVKALAEGVVVAVLVVVTHLAWFLGARKLGSLNGLSELDVLLVGLTRNASVNGLGELHVLLEGRARNGGVNGELVDLSVALELWRARRAGVNGEVVDLGLLRGLVLGAARASFNSEVVDLSLLGRVVLGAGGFNGEVVDLGLLSLVELGRTSFNGVVVNLEGVGGLVLRTRGSVDSGREVGVGTDSLAVLALSDVDGGGVVGMTLGVDLYVGVRGGVLRSRLRSTVFTNEFLVLVLLVLLLLDTGTAVTFFFTRNSDLFFTVVLLFAARRNDFSSGGRERRVLTFPSGLWLWGFDLNLFLNLGSGGLSLGLGLLVPICRWEDAEGDGDAGLKVQIDDFCRRERTFSYNLPKLSKG